jgi:deferrochelatase/peroxidase EfeB
MAGDALVGPTGPNKNDFDYSSDLLGEKCPFHAHIRKNNPRSDVPGYGAGEHRIVRRGIPYGPRIERTDEGAPKDNQVTLCTGEKEGPIGLLFLCAQGDIATQFEHLQGQWANRSDQPQGKLLGVDALIGQLRPGEVNRLAIEDKSHKMAKGLDTTFDAVIKLRGGEYFFAPSISFLRRQLGDLLR